ncbi:MAG TPA: MFS transporter [Anaerolineaceae bacterium]|jgi:GPH family glycoside/pentoside/hexuronide:cation symporter|nr:MFS transporter [Anaerolineaceae bacterium]
MTSDRLKSFNYAIGMFGTSIPINMFKTYAAIFYVDRLGLTTPQLATILLIYTFIDALDNPIYGFLSDRTRTRWGRRRPWLVIGTPLLILFFIGFFSTPETLSGQSLFIYALLLYILTGTLDSVINANYGALFPELFRTDQSRATTNALRQAFQLVAMIISIALTPMVTGAIGYQWTAIVYGLLGGAVILYMTFTSREVGVHSAEQKPELWNSLKDLFLNRKFWIAGLANAFYSATMSLVMVSLPFFVKYTLQIPDSQSTLLFGSVLLIAIGCVAIWARLVRKFSLIPVWRAALITLTVAFIPLYFANSLVSAIIGSALVGFGFAGVITTMDLIHAKVMDEDTQKHHLRREGIISNALGFMNRLNGLFTSLAFTLVFLIFKFESGQNPGPDPANAARFLLTVFPPVLMLFSIGFSFLINFPAPVDPAGMTEPSPEPAPEAVNPL